MGGVIMQKLLLIIAAAATTNCTHRVDLTTYDASRSSVGDSDRINVANNTCDAQTDQKSGYLSAIQNLIANQGNAQAAVSASTRASLDSFREEVEAAYRNVVMRCKTHMQCLEVNGYNEARCYMAASDRKDAEREFGNLSYQLRDLQREVRLAEISAAKAAAKANKPGPSVTVETTVTQTNKQDQTTKVGDDIADQDVLVMCDTKELLKPECRKKCNESACR